MAVYTRIGKATAARLARAYGLGKVVAFDGVAKGSVNTNYRLQSEAGTFFLRLDETRTRRQVEQERELVEYLAAHRFPTPRALGDAAGRSIRLLGGKPLQIYPWVPGEDFPAEAYSRAQLAEAGRMLARLHLASAGFPTVLPNRFGLTATAARWARIRRKAKIPESDRREIDDALASFSLAPVPPGPRGVVHGDWFADNLLFQAGRIVSVLDFEAAATDHLAFDVATAVNALCWKPATPDRFDRRRVNALLEGYSAGKGPADLAEPVLGFWLRASAVRFTVTRVADFRLRKSSLRVEKDYRDFLRRLRFWS